jgi:broad specificity phosphatase PhoE
LTRFILVRHGETNWNQEGRYQGQIDIPLSERGIDQGYKVAAALKHVPIDLCYSSPLSRSYDTAKMCMEWHGGLIKTDDRLLEINHGLWEGKLAAEIAHDYGALLTAWRTTVVDVTMPEGESIGQVRDRAMAAFREYALQHTGKTVLVLAHDAVNKAVICEMLDIGLDHFWQIKQDNTCINVLEYHDNKWRMILLNSTNHLGFLYSAIEQKGL